MFPNFDKIFPQDISSRQQSKEQDEHIPTINIRLQFLSTPIRGARSFGRILNKNKINRSDHLDPYSKDEQFEVLGVDVGLPGGTVLEFGQPVCQSDDN